MADGYGNHRVAVFDADTGAFKRMWGVPFARNLALSADPDQQFLYVGGGGNMIFVLDRKTLEIVGNIQPPGILGQGHEIAVDSKGHLYIAQTAQGLQKLTFKGMTPAGE